MSYSQVSISNLALALLGEAPIRDFDEDNKRARMCQTLFVPTRDYLLSNFDWPFARAYRKLEELIIPEEEQLPGKHAYALPANCRVPLTIEPNTGHVSWEVRGAAIWTDQTIVGLHYTRQDVEVITLSDGFVNVLSVYLATRLAPALSGSKTLMQQLYAQYKTELAYTIAAEANIGNTYRSKDNDPTLDTFSVRPYGVPSCID